MKLLGNFLLVACLIAGCLAAATAYVPRTSNPGIVGTTQTAPAGAREKTDAELARLRAMYEAGRLTAEAYSREREALFPIVLPGEDAELAKLRAKYEAGRLTAEEREALFPIVLPGEDAELAKLRAKYEADGHFTAEEWAALVARLLGEDAEITEEVRARMTQADDAGAPVAEFVKVQEFSVGRWPFAWLFALSAVGLFVGAMLVRTATKRQLQDSPISPGVEGAHKEGDPVYALVQTREICEGLLRDLPAMPTDRDRLDAIVDRVGEAQKVHLAAFVDARPRLIAKLGMGGYAEMMDRFAAAERQINRAWSAAADGYLEESLRCLHNAPPMLEETETKLF